MSHSLSPLKVVLVDDAPLILDRLQSTLASLAEVDVLGSAKNVADALALIERLRPDAVVLDLRLPDGSGTKVLQHAKQNADAPAVIVLTAHPSAQIREKCLALGADYFFDKALEFRRVAQALKELASKANDSDGGVSQAPAPGGFRPVAGSTNSRTSPQPTGNGTERSDKLK